uniref:Uncharacterized protein n=1 Tax=Wolbachia endosymbiont of Aleurodicus dispersus TaxID=1288877 RepID=A0A3B0IWF3_9RICK
MSPSEIQSNSRPVEAQQDNLGFVQLCKIH